MTRRAGVHFFVSLYGFYLLTGPASAQNIATANDSRVITNRRRAPVVEGQRARELVGKKIENTNGERLGVFKDLIVNLPSARVDYVVISTGGFAGIGAQLKVVPPEAVSPATAKRDTLALDISIYRWKSSPIFKKDQLAWLADPVQARQIYQFYKQPWPAAAMGQGTPPPGTPAPTGRVPRSELAMASDLFGKHVVTPQRQDEGKISDLLVDLRDPSKAALALVKPNKALANGGQSGGESFAIPVNAFRYERRNNRLLLNITPAQFQQAPRFDPADWPQAGSAGGAPQVYLYPITNE